jgi:hypothetical protein
MRKAAVLASAAALLLLAAVGSGAAQEIHPTPGHYVGETLTNPRRVEFWFHDGHVGNFHAGGSLVFTTQSLTGPQDFEWSAHLTPIHTERVSGHWTSAHEVAGKIVNIYNTGSLGNLHVVTQHFHATLHHP